MIIIGQEHVTPYKHVEKLSVYRNYDADEENCKIETTYFNNILKN